MRSIFSLVRLPNLLIIALTQYAMRYFIMEPLLPSAGFSLQLDNFHFALLVLSTVFISAAGYIINDYFDIQTDWINKPERVVVGVSINRRMAMTLHTVLNLIGLAIGIYLSVYIKLFSLSFIFLLTSGLLWFYSTSYKKQFLIGNLTVAFMTSLVPMIVILFELPLLNREYGTIMLQYNTNFNYIFIWVTGFAVFAFITTFIREIIKDAEDFEGDHAYGMKTIPIKLGMKATKVIIMTLILICVVMLLFILIKFIMFSGDSPDFISLVYFVALLVLPFFVLSTMIIMASKKIDYRRASLLIKIIMLTGVLYSAVVFFLIKFWV
jgi:4-hydroxybenzoate polyprenyltransferase